MTIAGPSSGKKCILPFIYKGITHNGCTRHGIEDTEYEPWCSTKVDDNGVHIGDKGHWGDCSPECPFEWCEYGLLPRSSQDKENDQKGSIKAGKNVVPYILCF